MYATSFCTALLKNKKITLFQMSKSCMFLTKQRKRLVFLSLNILKGIENFEDDEGDPAKLEQVD